MKISDFDPNEEIAKEAFKEAMAVVSFGYGAMDYRRTCLIDEVNELNRQLDIKRRVFTILNLRCQKEVGESFGGSNKQMDF